MKPPSGSFHLPRHLSPEHRAIAAKQFPHLFKSLPPPPPGRLTLPKRLKPEHRALALAQFPDLFKNREAGFREVRISVGTFGALVVSGIPVVTAGTLAKSRGHKYVRRWRGPNGEWNYAYNNKSGGMRLAARAVREGNRLQTQPGHKGRFKVQSVHKDHVVLRHKETGRTFPVPHGEVEEAFYYEHRHGPQPRVRDKWSPPAKKPPQRDGKTEKLALQSSITALGDPNVTPKQLRAVHTVLRYFIGLAGFRGHREILSKLSAFGELAIEHHGPDISGTFDPETGRATLDPLVQTAIASARRANFNHPRHIIALVAVVHEVAHAFGPETGEATAGLGRVICEVSNELTARAVVRSMLPAGFPEIHPEVYPRRAWRGSYQEQILILMDTLSSAGLTRGTPPTRDLDVIAENRDTAAELLDEITRHYRAAPGIVRTEEETRRRWLESVMHVVGRPPAGMEWSTVGKMITEGIIHATKVLKNPGRRKTTGVFALKRLPPTSGGSTATP